MFSLHNLLWFVISNYQWYIYPSKDNVLKDQIGSMTRSGFVYDLVIYKLFKLTMTTFWRFNHLILKANDDNVWCYVYYYIWHYVWLNVVINKIDLLLSKMMVTWIFGYYHIVHEMHRMWFMWKVTEDIIHRFFVNSEF